MANDMEKSKIFGLFRTRKYGENQSSLSHSEEYGKREQFAKQIFQQVCDLLNEAQWESTINKNHNTYKFLFSQFNYAENAEVRVFADHIRLSSILGFMPENDFFIANTYEKLSKINASLLYGKVYVDEDSRMIYRSVFPYQSDTFDIHAFDSFISNEIKAIHESRVKLYNEVKMTSNSVLDENALTLRETCLEKIKTSISEKLKDSLFYDISYDVPSGFCSFKYRLADNEYIISLNIDKKLWKVKASILLPESLYSDDSFEQSEILYRTSKEYEIGYFKFNESEKLVYYLSVLFNRTEFNAEDFLAFIAETINQIDYSI